MLNWRYGPKESELSRFSRRVKLSGDCAIWMGNRNRGGYGRFDRMCGGKQEPAHRLTYQLFNGPVPIGLELDHICRQRACVNPHHLEAVTRKENLHRSPITLTHLYAIRKCCVRGHEYLAENTYITKNGGRRCRKCHAIDERQRQKEGQK